MSEGERMKGMMSAAEASRAIVAAMRRRVACWEEELLADLDARATRADAPVRKRRTRIEMEEAVEVVMLAGITDLGVVAKRARLSLKTVEEIVRRIDERAAHASRDDGDALS